ncbi:LysR family transcriptional regulator [Actinocatenispora rupis]|uniref:LysR family transcriptional regulator n=1 Tax=Actinocatenispora rupis TaxID=519421 RepID=A0A8J3NFL6_9ACTN|nr:LysR family transcriptional regulator [Actinocatenispora rupis]GID15442.1 LysR family transcriptional regulator [Actinocatenispora rupis]
MDGSLETRELAHFLAVAEDLHFSRAAARLGIAQPALSRTVRRLERRLGVTLFVRTSRAVALTPAGRVLASEARRALDAVDAAARRTRRAGAAEPHLVLAMKAGGDAGLLAAVLATYEGDPDACPVRVLFRTDRVGALRDGHADAALVFDRLDDLRGLDTEPLLTEPRAAVLPASHPLAARDSLCLADLRDAPVHRPGDGTEAASLTELLQLVALGRTVAVVPRSVAAGLRHDLVGVPLTDAPPVTLLLAWPAHSTSPAVAALARAVRAACPGGDPVDA